MPRRRRRFRVPPRYRPWVETGQSVLLLLLLPVLLVLALGALPLVVAWATIAEKRRLCPHCGLRGTLRDVTPPIIWEPEEEGVWLTRYRTVRTRLWQCEVCGTEFEERDGELLRPAVPEQAPEFTETDL